jgi:hypothetical protein
VLRRTSSISSNNEDCYILFLVDFSFPFSAVDDSEDEVDDMDSNCDGDWDQ